jgi:hypothetical protein
VAGHGDRIGSVENGVTSTHHEVHRILPIRQRPLRCLRHRVWMASCTECCAAHAQSLKAAREATPSPN